MTAKLTLLLFLTLALAAPALADEPLPVPQPTPEALAYHHGQDLFWLAEQALGFLVPAIILFTGWGAGIRAWAARVTGGRWYPTLALFSAIFVVISAIVGAAGRADALARTYEASLDEARSRAARLPRRPKVFFEEWDEPLISGIGWVSELVQAAGGDDIFPERARQAAGKDRIVSPEDVVARQPDIIIGSWCGKKFQPAKVRARPGFDSVPAVANNRLHEIKSSIILQPGPAALTDGLKAMQRIIEGAQ